jgi:hypothetical protein
VDGFWVLLWLDWWRGIFLKCIFVGLVVLVIGFWGGVQIFTDVDVGAESHLHEQPWRT